MRWERLRHWGLTLVEFSVTQLAVQALTALAGILIIRSMSKPEYVLFAITNSMQTACNLLADLGIGVGVRSIGGRVWNDRLRFGQLLNTAIDLRQRFALVSFSFCLPIAAWMLWRNGANVPVTIGLCLVVAGSTIPLLATSVWGASAGLYGEYRRIQKLDLGSAILRLVLIDLLVLTWITAFLASLVGVVTNCFQAVIYRRWAGEKADFEALPNADDRQELMRLSMKSLLNAIFFCFQGQITLLILTLMGNRTGIADVTALSRISMLFMVFTAVFTNVLSPRFARCQDPRRLPKLYLWLISGAVVILLPLTAFAWFLPGPFLWMLGTKYADLKNECGWVVAAICITQLGGAMWNLNCSKAWIQFQSIGFIPAIISVQIIAAFTLNLEKFNNVLIFNFLTALAPIPLFALDAWFGLRRISRSKSLN